MEDLAPSDNIIKDYIFDLTKADVNPEYVDETKERLNVTVYFPSRPDLGIIRYTCAKVDPNFKHSERMFNEVISNPLTYGKPKPYVYKFPPIPRKQLATILLKLDIISSSDAIAYAVKGDLPDILLNAIQIEDELSKAMFIMDISDSTINFSKTELSKFLKALLGNKLEPFKTLLQEG